MLNSQYLIKVALLLELELGFNLVNHIIPRGNPNTNTNMNPIPIAYPRILPVLLAKKAATIIILHIYDEKVYYKHT